MNTIASTYNEGRVGIDTTDWQLLFALGKKAVTEGGRRAYDDAAELIAAAKDGIERSWCFTAYFRGVEAAENPDAPKWAEIRSNIESIVQYLVKNH